MTGLVWAMGVLLASGATAAWFGRVGRDVSRMAAAGVVLAAVLGGLPALRVLSGGGSEELRLPWAVPCGELHLELDALSAWFLLPVFGLSAVAAVSGAGYLGQSVRRRAFGPVWLWFNVLVISLVLVLVARNAVLFLVAWEVMAVSSFLLVGFEDERAEVRQAAWLYLVAANLGTAFLVALFLAIGKQTGLPASCWFLSAGMRVWRMAVAAALCRVCLSWAAWP